MRNERVMRHYRLLITFLSFLFGLTEVLANDDPNSLRDQIISAHGTAGRAWLPHVELIAENLDEEGDLLLASLQPQIERQLKYLVGQFHGLEGGVELHQIEITDVRKQHVLDQVLAQYRYSVEMNAILAKTVIPKGSERTQLSFWLPNRVNDENLTMIFDEYHRDCVPNPHKSYSEDHYWYYFRPSAYYCSLNQPDLKESDGVTRVELLFDPIIARTESTGPRSSTSPKLPISPEVEVKCT